MVGLRNKKSKETKPADDGETTKDEADDQVPNDDDNNKDKKESESPNKDEADESVKKEEAKDDSAKKETSQDNDTKPTEEDDQPTGPTLQVSVDNPPPEDNDADGDDVDDQAGPTLQFTFQQNTDDVAEEVENEKPSTTATPAASSAKKRPLPEKRDIEKENKEAYRLLNTHIEYEDKDPQSIADKKLVAEKQPETELEKALTRLLKGKENHVEKLTNEIKKLKGFISKRKQTYKRKRKDEGAPTRALSAYNIFVQDQFAKLAKKNSQALQSADTNAQLERVPPANLVASTGGLWKDLPEEEKEKYRERAKSDRKRYNEQMEKYQPPDKAGNRKRNKTGYNMFFSAHVLRLKQSEMGVPSERGSVARLVGTAWKQLSVEEKQYYEREADKHNGMNPVEKADDDDKEGNDPKDPSQGAQAQQQQQQAQQQPGPITDPYAAHVAAQHGGYDPAAGYAHAMAQQHDPRVHGYYYAQPHYYDYSGHPHQPPTQQPPHGRPTRGQYQYAHAQQPHGYYDK